ncbi:MAG TPA: hypothetical protein VE690_09765, partial [Rhodopila sp.]|nr:hypothetical protein [Rhodopila sp.]
MMRFARRTVLHSLGVAALRPAGGGGASAAEPAMRRVRPDDPDWPPPARWEELNRAVGGRLIKVS